MDYMGIIFKGLELGQKPFIKDHFLRELSKGIKDGFNVDELLHGMRRGYNFLKFADHLNPSKGEPRIIVNRETGFPPRYFITAEDLNLVEKTINEVEAILTTASPENLIPSQPETTERENPHPRIFTSAKAWKFFQGLKTDFVRNELADYSYIFHKMKIDGYIFDDIKQMEFINWLNDTFNIELNATQLKSHDTSRNVVKDKLYTTIKQLFK